MSDVFYEEDEPVEKIRAAFDRGEKGTTTRPRDLNQLAASIVKDATTPARVGVSVVESSVTVSNLRFTSGYITVGHPHVTIR